ncbi:hypothetical protein GOV13_05160, partial [Candidatus Pacearchaeota archaeon]|nr:hypothetical protein [Candidatus Pacearchaeota archaeon]
DEIIQENNNKINSYIQKISYLKSQLSPGVKISTPIDSLIENAKQRISSFEETAAEHRKEKQTFIEDLEKLEEDLFKRLDYYGDLIRTNFKKYASAFLGIECDLKLTELRDRRRGIAYNNFFPIFNNKVREKPSSVSDSQRLFLDHAFRMAIISIYKEATKGCVFYIAETPEGTLDLAYLNRVGEMFAEFGVEGHTVVITSNLNRVGFLPVLFSKTENRTKRLLNLMEIGRLSNIQTDNIEEFNKILRLIG